MSWLRLPDFEASNPELVHDDAGNLIEVLVEARPKRETFDVCCLAQKLVKNGTKAVRYRDPCVCNRYNRPKVPKGPAKFIHI